MTTSPAIDRRSEALALYRSMRTEDLHRLRHAFEFDRLHTTVAASHAFIDARIVLIDRVLQEREKLDD